MATGTPGSAARDLGMQVVHFLRKPITHADNGNVITLGGIPAGSLILKPISGVHVTEAFNAGTNNYLDVGTSANDDLFGTDMSLETATFVPLDETVGDYLVAADTILTATVGLTGTAATAGAGVVVIAYIPNY